MIRLLFPGNPLAPRRLDPDYEAEAAAAEQLGFAWSTIHLEAMLEAQDLQRALRFVPQLDEAETGVYRGWMLRPEAYAQLYAALMDRGITLVNTPEQYRHAHYLPESYEVIRNWTADTMWLTCGADVQMDAVHALLQPFGDRPVIVKDWVKSRKHEWHEACYIPSAADRDAVERVVRRFIQLQGPDLAEGLVFREYLPLESIGTHSRSASRYRGNIGCSISMESCWSWQTIGTKANSGVASLRSINLRTLQGMCVVASSPWIWRAVRVERG